MSRRISPQQSPFLRVSNHNITRILQNLSKVPIDAIKLVNGVLPVIDMTNQCYEYGNSYNLEAGVGNGLKGSTVTIPDQDKYVYEFLGFSVYAELCDLSNLLVTVEPLGRIGKGFSNLTAESILFSFPIRCNASEVNFYYTVANDAGADKQYSYVHWRRFK